MAFAAAVLTSADCASLPAAAGEAWQEPNSPLSAPAAARSSSAAPRRGGGAGGWGFFAEAAGSCDKDSAVQSAAASRAVRASAAEARPATSAGVRAAASQAARATSQAKSRSAAEEWRSVSAGAVTLKVRVHLRARRRRIVSVPTRARLREGAPRAFPHRRARRAERRANPANGEMTVACLQSTRDIRFDTTGMQVVWNRERRAQSPVLAQPVTDFGSVSGGVRTSLSQNVDELTESARGHAAQWPAS